MSFKNGDHVTWARKPTWHGEVLKVTRDWVTVQWNDGGTNAHHPEALRHRQGSQCSACSGSGRAKSGTEWCVQCLGTRWIRTVKLSRKSLISREGQW